MQQRRRFLPAKPASRPTFGRCPSAALHYFSEAHQEFILTRARCALTCLTALPFVSQEIHKHGVLQVHTAARKP
jgi:hypothetical protein